jgi:hypothetical protein
MIRYLKPILLTALLAGYPALYYWGTGQYAKGFTQGYEKRSNEVLEVMRDWEELQKRRLHFMESTVKEMTQAYTSKKQRIELEKAKADHDVQNLIDMLQLNAAHSLRESDTAKPVHGVSASTGASNKDIPTSGSDGTAKAHAVVAECAGTLVEVVTEAEQLKAQVEGLQAYASVCSPASSSGE